MITDAEHVRRALREIVWPAAVVERLDLEYVEARDRDQDQEDDS